MQNSTHIKALDLQNEYFPFVKLQHEDIMNESQCTSSRKNIKLSGWRYGGVFPCLPPPQGLGPRFKSRWGTIWIGCVTVSPWIPPTS